MEITIKGTMPSLPIKCSLKIEGKNTIGLKRTEKKRNNNKSKWTNRKDHKITAAKKTTQSTLLFFRAISCHSKKSLDEYAICGSILSFFMISSSIIHNGKEIKIKKQK
jgi:hypothetical protein